jgi:hypothetical protein
MAANLRQYGEHAPWLRKIGLHASTVPIDFQAMQVYADWLQEKNEDDPRVKFWRAMGQYRGCVENYRLPGHAPAEWVIFNGKHYGTYPTLLGMMDEHIYVPRGMFEKLEGGDCYRLGVPIPEDDSERDYWRDYPTRRQAMIALCLAFCEAKAEDREAFVAWLGSRPVE